MAVLVWICVLTAVLCFAAIRTFYRKRRKGEPEIVKGSILFGSAIDFNQHAVSFLHKCRDEYGDVFTIRLVNQYLTVIMDPHAYETVSKTKTFDFDAIQRQVNWNVFSFVLKDARKMIKETGRTVRGNYLNKGIANFQNNLLSCCENAFTDEPGNWSDMGLRTFASKTAFGAIFDTVFGRSADHPFNSTSVYKNFETYHRYFNFLWLGFPRKLFPAACKALEGLLVAPSSNQLLHREDCSDYIKFACRHMLERGQNEAEILGHNLVYLHVNYNTFRLIFWALNNLLEYPDARKAVENELKQAIEDKLEEPENQARFTVKEVESFPVLDSFVQESFRMASGVFMVRYVTEDTEFQTHDGKSYLIRKGDRVAIYPPAIHKDPKIFTEPLEFQYDRFHRNGQKVTFYKDGDELKHPVMPFGTICPGQRYATIQIKWYLMTVLNMFDMELYDGEHAEYDYQYHGHEILPPSHDVNCKFLRREQFTKLILE
ncbi:cytochrome P450 7A1-like [Tubulanus polymorphus]|uniref:cytochrome P450 7A1-like n=1 Tax=Tubulanus polymorphus TaxID=672921 RepID=UPI003DA64CFE